MSTCRRRGYWGHVYLSGLDSPTPDRNLTLGIAVHRGMERILLGDDIDAAVFAALDELTTLQASLPQSFEKDIDLALTEGLLRGWHRVRWPRFQATYEVLTVEKEVRVPLSSTVVLAARVDAVLRHRVEDTYWVLNWKTTSSTWDWTSQWETNIQSWTEAHAMEKDLGVYISGVIYEGLFKGNKYKGSSTSPLVSGYRKLQPDGTYTYGLKYGEGWKRFYPWQVDANGETAFEGGLKEWLAFLPEDVVAEQYVTSYPVLKSDAVVEEWIRQTVREESDIDHMLSEDVSEDDRLTYFRPNFRSHCRWCPFKPACLLQTSVEEMVLDGILVVKEDHHQLPEGEPSFGDEANGQE